MVALRSLDLSGNAIASLPELSALSELRTVDVSRNQLTELGVVVTDTATGPEWDLA